MTKTNKVLSILTTFFLILTLFMPLRAFAEEITTEHIVEDLPLAVNGVIDLDADGTYNGARLKETTIINGNGASIVSPIFIETSEPIEINSVVFEVDTSKYNHAIHMLWIKDNENLDNISRPYHLTVENSAFESIGEKHPYRWIYLPESGPLQKESSMILKNNTFGTVTYGVNLLSADYIEITGNTFNQYSGTAVQYSVTEYNSINTENTGIYIKNNTFNGPGFALLSTITNGSRTRESQEFGSISGIGQVEDNTFINTELVVSVSNLEVDLVTIVNNEGLTKDNVLFSNYSQNVKFKPAVRGPLTEELEGLFYFSYLVSYYDSNDNLLVQELVLEGNDPFGYEASGFPLPELEGYTLTGWSIPLENINEHVDVYPVYEVNKYTVTFMDKEGKVIGDPIVVEHGQAATAPNVPVVEGFNFVDWDKDFSKVMSDLVVKALYEEKKVEVPTKPEVTVIGEGISVQGLDEAVKLTEEELLAGAAVTLEVKILDETSIDVKEKDLLYKFVEENLDIEEVKFMYLDISLFKNVGSESTSVNNADGPIRISFVVPEQYLNGEFKLLRIHDGQVDELVYDYNEESHIVTFETSRFSTYALVSGTAREVEKLPEAGNNAIYMYGVSAISIMAGALIILKLRKEQGLL